ncbi:hypothetical protein MKW98_011807 [Papaver atlanticum]|uniref:RanBD1 domain-containing protein n=1 Tax=Papaver atlanticum TaxID=357466 RepID=A0AAD4SN63_9MAGN|nr:hypothetical protein MKW98_011807 [Papaver atlanticum]
MKRSKPSDPTPDTNDNVFKAKRIIAGSPFDSNRKEQPSGETKLDVKRAEESHQHVRALNKQFASWVQLQLQHHPDELWQDGVQDYLTHAMGIMDKYSDIVAWIKANATKGESVTSAVSHGTENKSIPEVKSPELKFPSNNNSVFGTGSAFGNSSAFGNNSVFGNNNVFGSDKKLVPEAKKNEVKFQSNNNSGFGPAGSTFGTDNKLVPEAKNNEVKFQSGFGVAGSTFGTDNKLVPEAKNNEVKFQTNKNSVFGLAGSNFGSDKKSVPEAKFQPNNNSVFGLSGSTFGSDKKLVPEAKNHEAKFLPNSNSVFGLTGSAFGTDKKLVPEAKNTEVKFQSNNNSVFGLSGSSFSQGTEKKLVPEGKNNEVKFQLNNSSVFGQGGSNASSANPWGSSLTSNSASPVVFGGSQTPLSVSRQASDDADAEDEVEQPSSPSVKKTGEKGIKIVHELKCKLYVKSTDPADKGSWKDKGVGQLSIRCKEGVSKATKESKPTIIVRNDVGKVLLNALLYPGIKTNKQKTAIVAIFHTSVETDGDSKVVAQTYLLRTKSEADRDKLASMIQEYAPAA